MSFVGTAFPHIANNQTLIGIKNNSNNKNPNIALPSVFVVVSI